MQCSTPARTVPLAGSRASSAPRASCRGRVCPAVPSPCHRSGADGETRTRTAFATAPSRRRVYQFHHVGMTAEPHRHSRRSPVQSSRVDCCGTSLRLRASLRNVLAFGSPAARRGFGAARRRRWRLAGGLLGLDLCPSRCPACGSVPMHTRSGPCWSGRTRPPAPPWCGSGNWPSPDAPNRLPEEPLPNAAPMSAPLPCWSSTRPIMPSATST